MGAWSVADELAEWWTCHSRNRGGGKGDAGVEKESDKEGEKLESAVC